MPAYNEAGRITTVLRAASAAQLVDEIVVVTDGCQDTTAHEARGFAALIEKGAVKGARRIPVRVIELEDNIGKGGAMTHGALRTEADVLLFLDADLIGLQPSQVDDLLRPCLEGPHRADMTLGLFGAVRGGLVGWWMGWCHRRIAAITGQRAIRRDVYLAVPGLTHSRFGVETAITRYVKHAWKLKVENVYIHSVTHPMKEEKIGVWRGARHRMAMYWEIVTYIMWDGVRQKTSARRRAECVAMRQRFGGRL